MPEVKVTFVSEPLVAMTAQALPDHAVIGAQYDAIAKDGSRIYAIFWSYEQSDTSRAGVYNPPTDWYVIDNMPAGAVTLDFVKALPVLVDAFGLHIPCVTP